MDDSSAQRRPHFQNTEFQLQGFKTQPHHRTPVFEPNDWVDLPSTWKQILFHTMPIVLSELLGTFFFMFLGCGALSPGAVRGPLSGSYIEMEHPDTHAVERALSYGFSFATVVQCFGHLSMAQLNPAVSISLYILGLQNVITLGAVVIAQLLGGIFGLFTLKTLSTADQGIPRTNISADFGIEISLKELCLPLPQEGKYKGFRDIGIAFLMEFFGASVLIACYCLAADHRNVRYMSSFPVHLGITKFIIYFTSCRKSGGSFNPARSFAASVVSGNWTLAWVYWAAPMISSVTTPVLYHLIALPKTDTDIS